MSQQQVYQHARGQEQENVTNQLVDMLNGDVLSQCSQKIASRGTVYQEETSSTLSAKKRKRVHIKSQMQAQIQSSQMQMQTQIYPRMDSAECLSETDEVTISIDEAEKEKEREKELLAAYPANAKKLARKPRQRRRAAASVAAVAAPALMDPAAVTSAAPNMANMAYLPTPSISHILPTPAVTESNEWTLSPNLAVMGNNTPCIPAIMADSWSALDKGVADSVDAGGDTNHLASPRMSMILDQILGLDPIRSISNDKKLGMASMISGRAQDFPWHAEQFVLSSNIHTPEIQAPQQHQQEQPFVLPRVY